MAEQPGTIPIPEPTPESIQTCPLCRVFSAISRGQFSLGKVKLEFPLYLSGTKWRSREEVQWRVRGRKYPAGRDDGCAFVVVHRNVSEKMWRPMGERVAGDWGVLNGVVKGCLEGHGVCDGRIEGKKRELPKGFRVVDVKEGRVSNEMPDGARYVALSYVWGQAGDGSIQEATKDTITGLMEYLDVAELPALVRDAMVVCREIGERYLWVDRYCIIQDDEADRAAQISAMADIYSAAGLVLVAAGVEGAGMPGISRNRSLPQTSEVIGGKWQVDVQRGHLFDGMKAPWNARGWTYQEALLNHRKLFFTDSQVYYECGLRITHEENLSYSSFDPAMHDKRKYIGATTSLTYDDLSHGNERFTAGVKGYAREPPWKAYVRHLGRYRRRQLSHLSDLLDAFSGILYALFGKDGVYCGLPLGEFDQGLLWTPARMFLERRKAYVGDEGNFPSWTWASAPVDVPSFEEVSFSYTLCAWFRPVEVDGEQKLIMIPAVGDGDPEKHVSSFLGTLGNLKDKWGDHFDLWNGILETTRDDVPCAAGAARMFDTVPRDSRLRDGMLITRAQVAKLHIEPNTKDSRGIAHPQLEYTIRNDQGDDVGQHVYDQNNRLTAALRSKSAFDFIALSVGRGNSYWGHTLQCVDALPEVAVDVDDTGKKSPGPMVNVMIVEREEGCCRRVGLGMVYLRAWKALDTVFETVILV